MMWPMNTATGRTIQNQAQPLVISLSVGYTYLYPRGAGRPFPTVRAVTGSCC